MVLVKVVAVAIIVIAIVIRYWISRRKFYRRTMAGLERFSSFKRAVIINVFERLMWFISWLLLIGGIAIFLMAAFVNYLN